MEKCFRMMLCMSVLLTPLLFCNDSNYERLLDDIDTQNLARLKTDLQDEEYLAPKLYSRLIDEAKGIHEKFQKRLSFVSDPRDWLRLLLGGPMTLVFGLAFIGNFVVANPRRFRSATTQFFLGYLTYLFGHATKKGYDCTYGRMRVDNALAIVQALERARDGESET